MTALLTEQEGRFTTVIEVDDLEHRDTVGAPPFSPNGAQVRNEFIISHRIDEMLMELVEDVYVRSGPPVDMGPEN
jgi:hypothetical protein